MVGRMKKSEGGADTGERLRAAAGRGFRAGGFGGAGVDALAKEAGLTSGAFYAHFGSKAEAFRAALADGLQGFADKVRADQAAHGADWREAFLDFYLYDLLERPIANGCTLSALTADAARADVATRESYDAGVAAIVAALAEGLDGPDPRARAWQMLVVLMGAAGIGRALVQPELRRELLAAAREAALVV